MLKSLPYLEHDKRNLSRIIYPPRQAMILKLPDCDQSSCREWGNNLQCLLRSLLRERHKFNCQMKYLIHCVLQSAAKASVYIFTWGCHPHSWGRPESLTVWTGHWVVLLNGGVRGDLIWIIFTYLIITAGSSNRKIKLKSIRGFGDRNTFQLCGQEDGNSVSCRNWWFIGRRPATR